MAKVAAETKVMDTGKVEFGFLYLYLMRELEFRATPKQGLDATADAACRVLLLRWGISPDEVDEANRLFWERLEKNKLGELQVAFDKFKKLLHGDTHKIRDFITDAITVSAMDMNLSENEAGFLSVLQNGFDLRQSEVQDLFKIGTNMAVGFNFFGQEYMKAHQN